ncbi:hypothetical protein A9798_04830 [Edwardsiella hoshinae]|uniref:Uncharacterized protein n=2 Tax=Edwardsiella hoshinae TaxID=93378 RepID=A0A376DAX5_9GAMM|nr:hypothetical protein A9798_04830 [Edwardsiella hoshinae]QPR27783.1 hypothetical protein I6G97_15455 [Edwardsiella hoshinae]STC86003.1 Uncharacterised protein [Edwardsiella hoshinae]
MMRCALFLLLMASAIPPGLAFSVDSLFKVDGENNRFFVLKNPENEPVYLSITLSELQRQRGGEYKEIPFNAEAFLSWPLYIDPPDVVIDAQGEVRVSVIRANSTPKFDRIIGVSFIPDALRQAQRHDNNVAISIGYKSWYIIPGSLPIQGEPTAWLSAGKIHFNNQSSRVLRFEMDLCQGVSEEKAKARCYGESVLLPGNKRIIDIPSGANVRQGRVTFSELSGAYQKEIALQSAR